MASVAAPRIQTSWTAVESPALASAAADRDAVAAQVKVEEKRWMPDLGVTIGMRKFGWSSEKAATIGLSATILTPEVRPDCRKRRIRTAK